MPATIVRTGSTKTLKEKAREMFDEVDDDKSGLLDVGEIIRLAKMLGVDLDLAQAQQAMEEMDEDQSGEVDFDEFYEWFKLANGDDDEIERGERKKGESRTILWSRRVFQDGVDSKMEWNLWSLTKRTREKITTVSPSA